MANAWDDQEPTDEILINCWHKFLQTPYGQFNVPDWFNKLQTVIQSQEPEDDPSEEQEVTREEWMILDRFRLRMSTSRGRRIT